MAQDFFGSGMKFPPQINPATGRFEVSQNERNQKETMDNMYSFFNSEQIHCSELGDSFINDTFMNNYKMDSRNLEEIQNQIKDLAAGYVPEWNFDIKNPDIGTALALMFAGQTEKNVNRFNHMLEKYRTELVKLLDISPLPARPAQTVILMEGAEGAEEGVILEKGSKFLAQSENEKQVFETVSPAYITPSKLKAIFMTSGENGKVLPIMGEFKKKSYIETEETFFSEEKKRELIPFSLFGFTQEGLEKQAVVFYHSCIFDVEDETIDCKIEAVPELLENIENGKFRFLYYTEEGFLPIESYRIMGNHVLLEKAKPNKPVQIDGTSYSVFVLEAKEPQKKAISIDAIAFSSTGSPRYVDYAGSGTMDYRTECFPVFGEKLDLSSSCYIGLEHYFSKKDARIYLRFHVSFEEKELGVNRQEEKQSLKLIKRRLRKITETQPANVLAEEISIEYFNGIGWKRLECDKEYINMFQNIQEDDIELSFLCPKDWEKVRVGSYYGRTIRIRLLKADNCDITPCVHQIPLLSELMVSYSYEEHFEVPEIGKVFSGTSVKDVTKELQEGKGFQAFNKGYYRDTSLYLGFDKKFVCGPISLWWQVEGNRRGSKLRFSYSTVNGFKDMKVTDDTVHLTRSGLMMFEAPSDMAFMELEGERCCWIRITDDTNEEMEQTIKILQIVPNGVTVYNSENGGKKGNVEAGTITECCNKQLEIKNIRNPLAAFGGCDMESKEQMFQRGVSLFSSGNRLVTEKDYEREALHFSDNIDKVSVITGMGKDGIYREKMLYIVPLMKDFRKESYFQIENELKQHLLEHCELSIAPNELQIEEPIFVKLNVEVWVSVKKMEDSFEIKNLVWETLENYLNPVANLRGKGWDIGVLPGKSQIMIRLNSLKNRAKIQHIMVTAKYEDGNGLHEIDIEDIKLSPFMVVMNGLHQIHITTMEEKEK